MDIMAYENRERVAGKTSWNFWVFTLFSEAPLNIATFLGFLSFLASNTNEAFHHCSGAILLLVSQV